MGRSFLKLWTSALQDEWFLGLSLTERGYWLMLLLLAKVWQDCGTFTCKSVAHLSSNVGCSVKTTAKVLHLFQESGKISVEKLPRGLIRITIVNYQHYQQLKGGSLDDGNRQKCSNSVAQVRHNCQIKSPRPDQTIQRPDKDKEHIPPTADELEKREGQNREQNPDKIEYLDMNEATKDLRLPLSPSEQKEKEEKKIRGDTIRDLKNMLAKHFAGQEIPKGGHGKIAGWLYKVFSAYDPAILAEEIMWIVKNKFPKARQLGELYSHVNKIKGKRSAELLEYACEARKFVNRFETRRRSDTVDKVDKESVN